MCIICNAPKYGDEAYGLHLQTGANMKKTADMFLEASKECADKEQGKRYKEVAYIMKKLTKEWNKLEEKREV